MKHARSLTQIDVRIRNPKHLDYATAELIRDVASYEPAKPNNAQLADDMRICFAWYATLKAGKKFKLSMQDIVALAKKIYAEIEKRKREGKMKHEWKPEDMKEHSRELFDIISKNNPSGILNKLNAKDQGCGKAWEVLFAEGMAVQYFENEEDARAFADEVNECSTKRGFAKDVNSLKYTWVPKHTKTKRCYSVNSKPVHYKCDKTEELETLPIYPGNTSDKYEPLELSDFLDKWDSFVIRKPFISLVGSLANWKRTEGDIDILVKAQDPTPLLEALDRAIAKCFKIHEEQMADLLIQVHQFIHTDSLFLNSQWRIDRAFPQWRGRISVLDDSFSGPFTNFVELADLAAVAHEDKQRQEMSEKKLKLFDWFKMLKPLHGRKKEEVYSIDSVIETIKSRKEDWFKTGTYIEIKFDGVHIQCHKQGHIAKLITEDGTDITSNCPTIVKELAAKAGDFIACGEMELWKEGKHQPRADCAGVLNAKHVHPDEKFLRLNIFDCIYHKK